jgi:hypothetical protein
VRATYSERRESPLELITRLEGEFYPLRVRDLVMQYLVTHPWNEKRIVLLVTRSWQLHKAAKATR